MRVVAEAR